MLVSSQAPEKMKEGDVFKGSHDKASCSHREECSRSRQPHRVSPGGMRMPPSKQQRNVSQDL